MHSVVYWYQVDRMTVSASQTKHRTTMKTRHAIHMTRLASLESVLLGGIEANTPTTYNN